MFWFVGPEVMSPPCMSGGSTCLGLPPGLRQLVGSEPSGRHALASISLYFPGLSLPDLLVEGLGQAPGWGTNYRF